MNSSTNDGAPLSKQAKLGMALLVICALAALFWPRGEKTSSEPGGFPLDVDGRPAKLGSQLAPVSLVHFWATWCPPCVAEVPSLQRLARDFRGQADFSVVMIAVADEKTKVIPFLGPGWDMVLFDPTWDVAHRYGTDQIPETYLVVRGQVVDKFVGATDWDDAKLRDRLTSLLGAPAPRTASARRGP
ncbi:MAG TPA: TlpA disulfide reductase family protein [Thermoanaerobaculia bacterium]|nr:TlpA disulfide reductase family protein [Thermoanaerobaculia bacterium]